MEFSDTSTQDPSMYVSGLEGGRWDGSATALPDLSTGAIVLYDVETTASRATFSVFISSGARPDVPTDDGLDYVGPSQVYTCSGRERDFNPEAPRSDRTIFTDCPAALVNLLPEDAAFASADVFDG